MLSLLWKSSLLFSPWRADFSLTIGFSAPGLPMWLQQPIEALPYIVLTLGHLGWYFSSSA